VREFCTYFDQNYLPQGLALMRSLSKSSDVRLWVLSLDDVTTRVLARLAPPHVRVLIVDDLLDHEPRLRLALTDRSPLEFYYACTPRIIQLVFDRSSAPQGVTYIDADMFFFGPCETIFAEAPQAHVLIVEHDSGNKKAETERGRFNVSLVHFADHGQARACLEWWGEATLRSTALGGDVWGDQKYLDEFPERFNGVHILTRPAGTLAPWNIWRRRLVRRSEDEVLADGFPVTVYHFARFLVISHHLFMPIRRDWLSRPVLTFIYRPYMRAIREAYRDIRKVAPEYRVGYTRRNLRGLLLGLLAGRLFYEGRLGLHRLGVWIPSGPMEWASRRRARGTRTRTS
jgi:hypothetical protein